MQLPIPISFHGEWEGHAKAWGARRTKNEMGWGSDVGGKKNEMIWGRGVEPLLTALYFFLPRAAKKTIVVASQARVRLMALILYTQAELYFWGDCEESRFITILVQIEMYPLLISIQSKHCPLYIRDISLLEFIYKEIL